MEIGTIKSIKLVEGDLVCEVNYGDENSEIEQTEEAIVYNSANTNEWPLPGDEVVVAETGNTDVIVSIHRSVNGISTGESIQFGRDSDGNIVSSVHFKNNGEVVVNGGGDSAAMTSKVDSIISDIDSVFRGWVPVANDGGAALKSRYTTAFETPPDTVESESLKVDK